MKCTLFHCGISNCIFLFINDVIPNHYNFPPGMHGFNVTNGLWNIFIRISLFNINFNFPGFYQGCQCFEILCIDPAVN